MSITNTTLKDSGGWGFYFYFANVTDFSNNVVTSNATGAGYLFANDAGELSAATEYTGNDNDIVFLEADTVSENQTWEAIDVP